MREEKKTEERIERTYREKKRKKWGERRGKNT